ncbi:conserved exported hypothetical protein [Exiguobacterium sp. 8H]|uniref:BsuPI-related putative proteinase inhibitor n=1 Tax=Exiguobacterium TaxID=33986 RepID=UPI0012F2857C|nr:MULTISPECIES: BsuPI-related putative proteinase inhibitor [Exiguobacterium]VXB02026.1 conserved exported hypothetical protein [Exiguobacterium sp. 8H]VXB02051.1 conserved exported hypothetical protein [Exiguobacterium sp. 8A]
MKKTWLLAVVTAILLVVAGCGKEEAKPSQVNSDSSEPPAPLTLDTEMAYDSAAQALSATIKMTNPNEEAVDVTFNTSQRYQLIIKQGDKIVFDYGSEFMFTESIIEEKWAADEQKIFDEVFLLDELEAGEYSVEVIGLGQVDGAPEIAVTDETTFTVESAATETPDEGTSETPEETPATEPQSDGAFRDVQIDLNDTMIQVSGYTDEVEFEWSVSDGHNIYAQGAAEVTGGGFTFGVLLDEAPAKDQPLFLEMTPIGGEVTSFKVQ